MEKVYKLAISVKSDNSIIFSIILLADSVCDAISRVAKFQFLNNAGLTVKTNDLVIEDAQQIGVLTPDDNPIYPLMIGGLIG